ncbi:hypothetical protein ACFLZB_04400 [Nanoarchaeota archaeon]
MSNEEKILQTMQMQGPVLPAKIARALGTNLLLASAQLSELASRKKVLISHLKIGGGSPVYYLPGQEEKLQRFSDELGSQRRQVFDLLKEKKVLRDRVLEPLMRVAAREIKDFAKPLEVNLNSGKEIFWKWYLIKNEEAVSLIKELLKPREPEPKVKKEEVVPEQEIKAEPPKEEPKVEEKKVEVKEEPKEEPVKEYPKPVVKEEPVQKEVKEIIPKPEIKEKPAQEKQDVFEIQRGKTSGASTGEKKEVVKKETREEQSSSVSQKRKVSEIKSEFFEKVKSYLNLKNIKIEEHQVLRKTEINLVLSVPTAVGEISYYAKAKGKKKCNDKDVSSAFLEGQIKKMPVLFLYGGEITKKAEEMLGQDIFKNLILLHLD